MQVEQLSRTIQMNPSQLMVLKGDERAQEGMRLSAINMTVNIDRRLIKLFELVENDLLGRLQCSANYISPYPVSAHCLHISPSVPCCSQGSVGRMFPYPESAMSFWTACSISPNTRCPTL